MATTLPLQSFLALAAVGWADGRMRKEEAAGLSRAAAQCGLTESDLGVLASAAQNGTELAASDLSALNDWERALTYALANWLARLDGIVNAHEVESLRALARATGLDQSKLDAARSAAYDIACLPAGDRPDRFDFATLEARLKEKLPATFRASIHAPNT